VKSGAGVARRARHHCVAYVVKSGEGIPHHASSVVPHRLRAMCASDTPHGLKPGGFLFNIHRTPRKLHAPYLENYGAEKRADTLSKAAAHGRTRHILPCFLD